MCIRHRQRGISLVELIMFIVIVSVARTVIDVFQQPVNAGAEGA
jgi:Tfp pilus assembly protein FimT